MWASSGPVCRLSWEELFLDGSSPIMRREGWSVDTCTCMRNDLFFFYSFSTEHVLSVYPVEDEIK